MKTGAEVHRAGDSRSPILSAIYSPDGKRIATSHRDGEVALWDSATAKILLTIKAHQGAVTCLAFSPDGRRLVTGGADGQLKIWDVASGKQVAGVAAPANPDRMLQAFQEEKAKAEAALAAEREARVRAEEAEAKARAQGQGQDAEMQSQRLLYLSQIRLAEQAWANKQVQEVASFLEKAPTQERGWEWRYLRHLSEDKATVLEGHPEAVLRLAFDPSGQRLASVGRAQDVLFWDTATGHKAAGPYGQDAKIRAAAFSPDGQHFAIGEANGTIRFLEPATGNVAVVLKSAGGDVFALAYSPDGQHVAWAGADRTVRVWQSGAQKLGARR